MATTIVALSRDYSAVSFRLADGRASAVTIASGASTADVLAAVQQWATAHPLDPLVGTAIT